MSGLSLADRATIANMSPEYGATMGFFPVDHVTLQYLKLTGRSDDTVSCLLHIRKEFLRVFGKKLNAILAVPEGISFIVFFSWLLF